MFIRDLKFSKTYPPTKIELNIFKKFRNITKKKLCNHIFGSCEFLLTKCKNNSTPNTCLHNRARTNLKDMHIRVTSHFLLSSLPDSIWSHKIRSPTIYWAINETWPLSSNLVSLSLAFGDCVNARRIGKDKLRWDNNMSGVLLSLPSK